MLLNIDKIEPQRIAALDSFGSSLSYGELVELSEIIKKTVTEKSLFFILTENNVGGIAWIIATILSGNVPLILNSHTEPGLLNNLKETYLPEYICQPLNLVSGEISVLSANGYGLISTRAPKCEINSDLSHLLPTSGSTGSPKLVRHSYQNIEASALNISTFFNIKSTDRPLLVLPLYYTMGLSVVFSHLKVGATILVTDLPMTDRNFWKFIKEEKATSFTGVPFSYQILDMMRFFRMDLPDLRLLTQGGGKMPRELNLKFAEWCRDTGREWIATYGQSEGTARMAYLPPKWAIEKAGSIGIAVPNGELWLIDSDGNRIEDPFTEGEMCYKGKNVTLGYATKRDDLVLGDERNGELHTGDLAYRDDEGCYYIKGRLGRFLKLYGNRVGLDESEHILKSHIKGECACVGTDEKLIVYLTYPTEKEIALTALLNALKIPATAIEIRVIESMPKNEAGKTLYSQLPDS